LRGVDCEDQSTYKPNQTCKPEQCEYNGFYDPKNHTQRWCKDCTRWYHNTCATGVDNDEVIEATHKEQIETWNLAKVAEVYGLSVEDAQRLADLALEPVDRGVNLWATLGNGNLVLPARDLLMSVNPEEKDMAVGLLKSLDEIEEDWEGADRPEAKWWQCPSCPELI
jgi:hypothetical protein